MTPSEELVFIIFLLFFVGLLPFNSVSSTGWIDICSTFEVPPLATYAIFKISNCTPQICVVFPKTIIFIQYGPVVDTRSYALPFDPNYPDFGSHFTFGGDMWFLLSL
jgi:hypothetical protein